VLEGIVPELERQVASVRAVYRESGKGGHPVPALTPSTWLEFEAIHYAQAADTA